MFSTTPQKTLRVLSTPCTPPATRRGVGALPTPPPPEKPLPPSSHWEGSNTCSPHPPPPVTGCGVRVLPISPHQTLGGGPKYYSDTGRGHSTCPLPHHLTDKGGASSNLPIPYMPLGNTIPCAPLPTSHWGEREHPRVKGYHPHPSNTADTGGDTQSPEDSPIHPARPHQTLGGGVEDCP